MRRYTEYNDNELMRVIQTNPKQKSNAFAELYNRYSSRVYLYCRKILGEGYFVEDIFQETFIKYLKAIENETIIENSISYLLRTCKNLILNHKRDNPHYFVEIDDLHVSFQDKRLEYEELTNLLESALSLLPEEHKEAFVLQAFEGMSYNEIGELTNSPVTTVRNRVVRAKRKIRDILKPYLDYTRSNYHE